MTKVKWAKGKYFPGTDLVRKAKESGLYKEL